MNYKNAYEELKRIYEKLEDKYIRQVPCCNEEDCDLFKEHQQLKINCNIGNENLKFYRQENKQLKDRMKKAVEIIKEGLDFDNPQYAIETEKSLLEILKEDSKDVRE